MENIRCDLEKMGYFAYYAGNDLIVGEKIGVFAELKGINVNAFCLIRTDENEFVIESGEANIVKEDRFSSKSKVVNFVKTTFPL